MHMSESKADADLEEIVSNTGECTGYVDHLKVLLNTEYVLHLNICLNYAKIFFLCYGKC